MTNKTNKQNVVLNNKQNKLPIEMAVLTIYDQHIMPSGIRKNSKMLNNQVKPTLLLNQPNSVFVTFLFVDN